MKLSRLATHLWNQYSVAFRAAHWYSLSILIESTRSDCQDLGFVELLDTALGEEDTTSSFGLGFDSLYDYSVQERDKRSDGFQGCCLVSSVR